MTASPIELVFYIDAQLLRDLEAGASLFFSNWVPRLLLYCAMHCQSASLVWDWKAFDPFSRPNILRYRSKRLRYAFDAASIRSSLAESKSQAQSLGKGSETSLASSSAMCENILWNLMQAVHDWPWTQSLGLPRGSHQLIFLLDAKNMKSARLEKWVLQAELARALDERNVELSFLPCPSLDPAHAHAYAYASSQPEPSSLPVSASSFSILNFNAIASPFYWLYALTRTKTADSAVDRAAEQAVFQNSRFKLPFHLHLDDLVVRAADTLKDARRARLVAILESEENAKQKGSLCTPHLSPSCSVSRPSPDASPPGLGCLSLAVLAGWLENEPADSMLDSLGAASELDPPLLDYLLKWDTRDSSFKELWINLILWTFYALHPTKGTKSDCEVDWELPLRQTVSRYLLLLALQPNAHQAEETLLRTAVLRLLDSSNESPELKGTLLALVEDCIKNEDTELEENGILEEKSAHRKKQSDKRKLPLLPESQPVLQLQTLSQPHRPEMEIQRRRKETTEKRHATQKAVSSFHSSSSKTDPHLLVCETPVQRFKGKKSQTHNKMGSSPTTPNLCDSEEEIVIVETPKKTFKSCKTLDFQ